MEDQADFDGEVPSTSRDSPPPHLRVEFDPVEDIVIPPPLSPTVTAAVETSTKAVHDNGTPKSVRQRMFPKNWETDYPWVVYDAADNSMHCRLCKEQGKRTIWGGSGTTNFRLRTLKDHLKSADHRHTVAAKDQRQTWVDVSVSKNNVRRRNAVTLAMQSCYWVVTQEVANCKYKALLQFLQERDLVDALYLNRGANATYNSSIIFNQLMGCLSSVLEKKLKRDLRHSPFVGIGVDESTDRATEKHLAIIVRYLSHDATCMTEFLDCVAVRDGKATTIVESVKAVAEKFGVGMEKVVSLGSD